MVKEIIQSYSENGYNLHTIQTDKFKTISIVIKMRTALKRENVTERALLPYVLQQGTETYPDFRSLRGALDDLYGAVLNAYGSKKGENQILTFRLETANESYLESDEAVFDSAVQLLSDILFKPKKSETGFDPGIVQREKETLRQKIRSVIDDKMRYANERLIDEMCQEEPYRLHANGYEEDLDEIDESTLFTRYKEMLLHDEVDIYVLGDLEGIPIEDTIASYFSREYQAVKRNELSAPQLPEKPRTVTEQQDVQQAKLHLGYRTNRSFDDPDYYALQVFNGLFGGFPSSKLFLNVREKHSLAYYAASRLESHKGLLFVFSGIDPSDYEKARTIIEDQMAEMKQGNFSEEQLNETKELIVNQMLETMDSPSGLIELFYNQVIGGIRLSPEEMIEKIRAVSKEAVVRAASTIELDTVYLLTGKGGQANE